MDINWTPHAKDPFVNELWVSYGEKSYGHVCFSNSYPDCLGSSNSSELIILALTVYLNFVGKGVQNDAGTR